MDADTRARVDEVTRLIVEKLLLEATLELIASGACVAIQDMGAAGLTSSSAEMAERGEVGVEIDTRKVPVREAGMTPYEILLSESQERMLVVAHRGREETVREILTKWDLHAVHVGDVTNDGLLRVRHNGAVVAEVPFVDALTTILDPSLPLTVTEWEEWGDPVHDPAVYDYMKSYSPYDNTVAADYPAMYVTAGLNDPRVSFHEPAKWVARLRASRPESLRHAIVARFPPPAAEVFRSAMR